MQLTTTTGLAPASALLGAEVVERKGAGHPDTLADGVADAISRAYSRYCLEQFGAILHHNTDKTSLLGGAADVRFGHGELTAPIQVLVNGRITAALGTQDYWRLRLGIGHPRTLGLQQPVADFVLHRPRKEEQALINEALDKSLNVIPLLCQGKFEAAMMELHTGK